MNGCKIIYDISELELLVKKLRENNKRIVFTNGCFDIIHYGHIFYLNESKKLGDILIVGINSDDSIRRIKGPDRPINSQYNRINVIAALQMVDYVFCFDNDTPIDLIDTIKPDIYTKGSDYKLDNMIGKGMGADYIKTYGGKAVIINRVHEMSSSNIMEKVKK